MPDLKAQLDIPPVSSGIGEARRFTKERLRTWGLDGLADTAILMVSELVTNAILHGGEGAVLTLVVADLKLRAEVRDSSPALPVVRSYSDTATTGRGMVIVDALAASWGTVPVDGGKVVWFELATDDPESGSVTRDVEPARIKASRDGSDFLQTPLARNSEDGISPSGRFRIAFSGSGR